MSTLNSDSGTKPAPGGAPRWLAGTAILLGLGVVGMIAAGIYQHSELVNAKMEIAGLQREVSTMRQDVGTAESRSRETFDAMKSELTSTRQEAKLTADQAKVAARRQAEALVAKAESSQEMKHKQLAAEVDEIKNTTDQATVRLTDIGSEVGEVKGQVGEVKTQVASTRSDLDRTIADLKRANGDMGVMSGLIATNAKELAALKEIGERDYYEFNLTKAQARRMLAGVNLLYKKADPKRNRFTLEVVADDKRVEKKDRTINEPIQFYVPSKARQPYELVINEIKKDTIVGYLSVPKVQVAKR